MADQCVEIITRTCPDLDEDMVEYVAGVLEGCLDGYSGVEDLIEGDDPLGELLMGYGVVEDEDAAAELCRRIDGALVEQGLVGAEVDGREAAKAAGGELKLLAQPAGIEQFEVQKTDARWDHGGLDSGLSQNADIESTGEVKMSKSAKRKAAKAANPNRCPSTVLTLTITLTRTTLTQGSKRQGGVPAVQSRG